MQTTGSGRLAQSGEKRCKQFLQVLRSLSTHSERVRATRMVELVNAGDSWPQTVRHHLVRDFSAEASHFDDRQQRSLSNRGKTRTHLISSFNQSSNSSNRL